MNHKRKRPKHKRAGCLVCKPYKSDRVKGGIKARAKSLWKKFEGL